MQRRRVQLSASLLGRLAIAVEILSIQGRSSGHEKQPNCTPYSLHEHGDGAHIGMQLLSFLTRPVYNLALPAGR